MPHLADHNLSLPQLRSATTRGCGSGRGEGRCPEPSSNALDQLSILQEKTTYEAPLGFSLRHVPSRAIGAIALSFRPAPLATVQAADELAPHGRVRKEQEEGTFFHILSLIVTTMHEPKFLPIDFAFDLDGRTARVAVPGILETASQPIRNPVTHQPHRIEVKMPEGFEYREAEIASAWIKGTGAIKFDLADGHGSLALVDHTPAGPV
jgi:hypothetical protein